MTGICILAEFNNGEFENISFELATLARTVADKLKEELSAVMFGENTAGSGNILGKYGVDKIYVVNDRKLANYAEDAYADALVHIISEMKPRILICGHTLSGKDIAQRLSAQMNCGLISNCTGVSVTEDSFLITSSLWQNKVEGTFSANKNVLTIMTLVPEIIDANSKKSAPKTELIAVEPEFDAERALKVKGVEIPNPEDISLGEAAVIVAVGKGVGGNNLLLIEEMARLLNGSLAASRAAVDEGWLPSSKQVGQTGKTVSPKLYIACGISGQIYHTLGMKDSKYIVAINKDQNAPIFKLADIGLLGDFSEIAKAVIQSLKSQ